LRENKNFYPNRRKQTVEDQPLNGESEAEKQEDESALSLNSLVLSHFREALFVRTRAFARYPYSSMPKEPHCGDAKITLGIRPPPGYVSRIARSGEA